MKTQITILGPNGLTGKKLVQEALNRGYNVKVLVRSRNKLDDNIISKIEVIEGEYFDNSKVDEALKGSQYVLSTIGPALSAKVEDVEVFKYHEALNHLLISMKSNGVKKIINISGAGIKYPEEKLPFSRRALRFMLKLTSSHVAKVKDEELKILFGSDQNFVNVRPPLIKDMAGIVKADEHKLQGMQVGVSGLASFMLDCIRETKWDRKAPVVGH